MFLISVFGGLFQKNFIYSEFLYLDMAFDIYYFVFYEILKYDSSSAVLRGAHDLQHDVVFGLLIPTVFIAIVLYFFVFHIFGAGHRAIGYLSSITALGVIISLGWVPLIAGLGGFAFVIILALAFVKAIYSRLVPKGVDSKLYSAGKKIGETIDLSSPVMSKKQERNLITELATFENSFKSAKKAIDNFEKIRSSTNINMEKAEAETQIERYNNMWKRALEDAVKLIESAPRHRRLDIIKKYLVDSDFKKRLDDIFRLQKREEEKK